MIYLKIKPRTSFPLDQPVCLGDVAQVWADAKWALAELPLVLPNERGIWLVDAAVILTALKKHCPEETVTLLGDSFGWIHRLHKGPDKGLVLWALAGALSTAAFLLTAFLRANLGWGRPSPWLIWTLLGSLGVSLGMLGVHFKIKRLARISLVIKPGSLRTETSLRPNTKP